ncbi:hypothetical protein J6590_067970 [Homalodisca vitripennis]|nr:hypothetical protein J6590_067970 [Homalodisca vitripennis]
MNPCKTSKTIRHRRALPKLTTRGARKFDIYMSACGNKHFFKFFEFFKKNWVKRDEIFVGFTTEHFLSFKVILYTKNGMSTFEPETLRKYNITEKEENIKRNGSLVKEEQVCNLRNI